MSHIPNRPRKIKVPPKTKGPSKKKFFEKSLKKQGRSGMRVISINDNLRLRIKRKQNIFHHSRQNRRHQGSQESFCFHNLNTCSTNEFDRSGYICSKPQILQFVCECRNKERMFSPHEHNPSQVLFFR